MTSGAVKGIGVQDHFGEVAKMDYLKKKYHMTAEDIVKTTKEAIAMKSRNSKEQISLLPD